MGGGHVYVIGGFSRGDNPLDCVECFHPLAVWTTVPQMPYARADFAAAVVRRQLFVAGGRVGGEYGNRVSASVMSLKRDGLHWTSSMPMPTARYSCFAAVDKDMLYVLGGASSLEIECLNTTTGKWARLPRMPHPHAGGCATAHAGEIYVFGGCGYLWDADSCVHCFSLCNSEWRSIPPMHAI